MTELAVAAVILAVYASGLKRDGLPVLQLAGAVAATYVGARLGLGWLFVAVGHSVDRAPTLWGESTLMAVGPVAAVVAYAVSRVLEARVMEGVQGASGEGQDASAKGEDAEAKGREASAKGEDAAGKAQDAARHDLSGQGPERPCGGSDGAEEGAIRKAEEAPAAACRAHDPSPHPRLTLREERMLAAALVFAACIAFVHTLATARPYWREDLSSEDQALLRRRAGEVARLEARMLDCAKEVAERDRTAYRQALTELERKGLLRLEGKRVTVAEVAAALEEFRRQRCGGGAAERLQP